AIRLYDQLGHQVANADHALAMKCYNRATWLRERNRGAAPAGYGYQAARPAEAGRLYPVPAGPTSYSAPWYAPPGSCPAGPDLPVRQGYLRGSGRSCDGKPTYVLESSQGQILSYVTAQEGVSLEAYRGKRVELAGPMWWRGDLRANYMTASRVTPLP